MTTASSKAAAINSAENLERRLRMSRFRNIVPPFRRDEIELHSINKGLPITEQIRLASTRAWNYIPPDFYRFPDAFLVPTLLDLSRARLRF